MDLRFFFATLRLSLLHGRDLEQLVGTSDCLCCRCHSRTWSCPIPVPGHLFQSSNDQSNGFVDLQHDPELLAIEVLRLVLVTQESASATWTSSVRLTTIYVTHHPLQQQYAVFYVRHTVPCSEQLWQDMLSKLLVAAESQLLPSIRIERNFQLQHKNSHCLHSTEKREFSRTEGGLVDVLVEFMFPSESGVTSLSGPRLMTTQETVFSICKGLFLISLHYLPYCRVTCTSSAGPMTVLSWTIRSGWRPFASLVFAYS